MEKLKEIIALQDELLGKYVDCINCLSIDATYGSCSCCSGCNTLKEEEAIKERLRLLKNE